ncbi:MAG: hypothetical protein ACI9D4_000029 [Polaribacter sp.]|jgi:hypothetical protein
MRRINFVYFLLPIILLGCSKLKNNTHVTGEDEIIHFHEIATSISLDSSYHYLEKAKKLILLKNNISDSLKAENNFLLGLNFKERGVLDSAAFYFYNATEFVNDSIYYPRQRDYYERAWNTFASLEKYGDCFTISNKFKSLLNKEKQHKDLTWAYYFEESIYTKLKQYDKSLQINKLRLQLAKEKDTTNILSAILDQADYKYYYLNDKKGAFQIMDSLINIEKDLSDNQKSFIYGEYGVYAFWEGDYQKALQDYQKSLQFFQKLEDPFNKVNRLAIKYNNIAEVCIKLKQYDTARVYLDSVGLLGIHTIERRLQKSFFDYHLQLASLTNKNINEVTRYIDTIYKHQDLVYSDKFSHELVALSKANINEKKLIKENQEIEIKSIKLKSRLILVIILTVLLIIIGYLFLLNRKQKFEQQNLQMQQRLLRAQMNPHFTFNTLYAIQNLLKDDPEQSKKYLLKFSRLLRLILENSLSNYVSIEDELESLKKYMDLQLLRFPDKFDYDILLNEIDEEDEISIPPMLIQPFVENSIEHGFKHIDYKGKINITLTLAGKYVHCVIEDNGFGITTEKSEVKQSTSLNLISDFIKKSTKKGVEIIDKKNNDNNESGVIIQFLIPIN